MYCADFLEIPYDSLLYDSVIMLPSNKAYSFMAYAREVGAFSSIYGFGDITFSFTFKTNNVSTEPELNYGSAHIADLACIEC